MLSDVIGWIGAVLVISAYFLVSTKKVSSTSNFYQLMNLLGAVGVGVNVFFNMLIPPLLSR